MAYSVSPGTPEARALLEEVEALRLPDYGDSSGGTKAPLGPRGVHADSSGNQEEAEQAA